MAPSAVAAVGVGGETIQRTCHFPRSEGTDQTYPEDLTMSKEKLELLEDQHANYHYYFIDEFGMVGAQTHGVLSTRLTQAKRSKLHVDDNSDVYGGSCVILFGHHAQLPPVSDPTAYDQLEKPKKPLTEHMKRGRALLKSEFSEVVILRRQMRQQLHVPGPGAPLTEEQKAQNTETKWFVGFLSRLMDGAVSGDDYWKLKAHNEAHSHASSSDFDSFQLCASYEEKTNKNAQIAANFARSKGVPLVPIHAINAGAPFARVAEARAARNLEPVLYLAKGVRVMSTWNGWQAQGVVNGAMGIVHEIIFKIGEGPGSMPEAVLVQFPEGGFYTGPSFLEGPGLERIVKFTPRTEKFTDRHFKSCSRTQFPLQLAHALTIHKSQGMTLGCVVLSLGVKEFSIGLSYVGASRVRSFGDLFFDPMPHASHEALHVLCRQRKDEIAEAGRRAPRGSLSQGHARRSRTTETRPLRTLGNSALGCSRASRVRRRPLLRAQWLEVHQRSAFAEANGPSFRKRPRAYAKTSSRLTPRAPPKRPKVQ